MRELDDQRQAIEAVLAGLGRDDIAVGRLRRDADGTIRYVLQKDVFTHEATIRPETLADPQAAMTEINLALRQVSKPAQRAHIAAAQRETGEPVPVGPRRSPLLVAAGLGLLALAALALTRRRPPHAPFTGTPLG